MNNLKGTIGSIFRFLGRLWSNAVKLVGSFVLLLMLFVIAAVFFVDTQPAPKKVDGQLIRRGSAERIAVVSLSGQIMQTASDQNLLSIDPFLITPSRTRAIINQLESDQTIKAVVVDLNSPGGSVVASDEIYQQFKQLDQKLPVIFRLNETGASGGYYLSLAGRQIVASPATITGSIGVIAYSPNVSGLMGKLGVELNVFKSGPYKDMGNPAREVSATEEEIFQSLVDDSYQMFVEVIAAERELEKEQVLQLADGRIYSGIQAQQNGLIDQVGGLTEAIDLAATEASLDDPTVFVYQTGGWWSSLLNSKLGQVKLSLLGQELSRSIPSAGLYYLWVN
ncbi:MAG: signal peptide peptidase SppA [Candidatus Pacebacteria bacterium]|nr:signal peptide peptidase SppA [Candidatus Paceibacterota bacterium]